MSITTSNLATQILCGCTIIVATLTMIVMSAAPNAEFVVAIIPPWWAANQRLQAAANAGEIVSLGQTSSIVVVHGHPGNVASNLWAAGAILVFVTDKSALCSKPKVRKAI